jgi:hypothetical protein
VLSHEQTCGQGKEGIGKYMEITWQLGEVKRNINNYEIVKASFTIYSHQHVVAENLVLKYKF